MEPAKILFQASDDQRLVSPRPRDSPAAGALNSFRPQNCGAVSQMFRATRSNAGNRQITTILQQVLLFRATDQPPTRSALLTSNWRGCSKVPDEAFINSQRHEGWVCLPAAYEDRIASPCVPPSAAAR